LQLGPANLDPHKIRRHTVSLRGRGRALKAKTWI